MMMRAKCHKVSMSLRCEVGEGEEAFEDDEEIVEVAYWVSDTPEGDSIAIEDNGNDQWPPGVALTIAEMIQKVNAWSKTKRGMAEIQRLRTKVIEAL